MLSKNKLLVVREVISRELNDLENKIIECRVNKIKYKYLEDRKEILSNYLNDYVDAILLGIKEYKNKDEIKDEKYVSYIEMPSI